MHKSNYFIGSACVLVYVVFLVFFYPRYVELSVRDSVGKQLSDDERNDLKGLFIFEIIALIIAGIGSIFIAGCHMARGGYWDYEIKKYR